RYLLHSKLKSFPTRRSSDLRAFEIIFIGRLERWKGSEWLIEAVARACKQVDCRLKIIGDLQGNERQRLAKRVSQLGIEPRVEFLDRKSTRLNSSHVAISYAV